MTGWNEGRDGVRALPGIQLHVPTSRPILQLAFQLMLGTRRSGSLPRSDACKVTNGNQDLTGSTKLHLRVILDECEQFVDLHKGELGNGVGTAVVDGDPPAGGIGQRGAREHNVRDVADALVGHPRIEEVGPGAI